VGTTKRGEGGRAQSRGEDVVEPHDADVVGYAHRSLSKTLYDTDGQEVVVGDDRCAAGVECPVRGGTALGRLGCERADPTGLESEVLGGGTQRRPPGLGHPGVLRTGEVDQATMSQRGEVLHDLATPLCVIEDDAGETLELAAHQHDGSLGRDLPEVLIRESAGGEDEPVDRGDQALDLVVLDAR
jgi:hypothetical protein